MVQRAKGPRGRSLRAAELGGQFTQMPTQALPGKDSVMKAFRSLVTGSRQLFLNGEEKGCPMAWDKT